MLYHTSAPPTHLPVFLPIALQVPWQTLSPKSHLEGNDSRKSSKSKGNSLHLKMKILLIFCLKYVQQIYCLLTNIYCHHHRFHRFVQELCNPKNKLYHHLSNIGYQLQQHKLSLNKQSKLRIDSFFRCCSLRRSGFN